MDRATARESRRPTMSERREYPRFPAAWPVEISVEQYLLVGARRGVSEYGICVACRAERSPPGGRLLSGRGAGGGRRPAEQAPGRFGTSERIGSGLKMHERLPME
jgi:hypothetical protein